MKLIIDIDDGKWQAVKDGTWCGSVEIANGTPLTEVFEDIKVEIDKLHKVGNANDGKVYVPINDVFDVIEVLLISIAELE